MSTYQVRVGPAPPHQKNKKITEATCTTFDIYQITANITSTHASHEIWEIFHLFKS